MIELLFLEVVVVISQGIISGYFFRNFFEYRNNRILVCFGWIGYFILQLFTILVDCIIPDIFLIICMYIIWSGFVYKGDWNKKLFYSLVFITFAVVSESAFKYLTHGLQHRVPMLQGKIASSIILFTLAAIVSSVVKKKNNKEDKVSRIYKVYLLFIPLGSTGIIFSIVYLANLSREGIHSLLVFFSALVVLLINMFVFSLYNLQAKHLEARRCNTVYEQQFQLHESYMKERELIWKELREKQHDFMNKKLVLDQLILNEQNEQAFQLLEDMNINRTLIIDDKMSKTDNLVIDTIINHKIEVAKEYNINFSIDLQIPINLPYKSSDLCIILGNLLDNSIDALKEYEGERQIKLKMKYDSNNLFVIIDNPFEGKRKRTDDGIYITTKKDVENHGFGLTSIKKIVDTHGGNIDIMETNNIFKVSISLFLG